MAARFQNFVPGAAVLRGARRGPSRNLPCFAADGFLAHGKDAAAAQVRRCLQSARGTHQRAADRLFRRAAAGLLGAAPVLVRLQRRSSLRLSRRRPYSAPRRGASRPAISVGGNARGKHSAGKGLSAGRRNCRRRTHSDGQGFASRRTIRGAASRRGRRFQTLARGELCRDRALAARAIRADSGGESRSRRRGDRRRGQRAPRAAERRSSIRWTCGN